MGIFLRLLPILVSAALVLVAIMVVQSPTCFGLTDDVAGALAGAMIGAAGIFIGSSLDRLSTWWNDRAELADRSRRIGKLVASELVNVAAGMICSHNFLRQCASAGAGVMLGSASDLRAYQPRAMPLSEGLGSELLNLSEKQIDVLSTLLGNLQITRRDFDELIQLNKPFGTLDAARLKGAVCHDMLILAEVFEQFAPTRKLELDGQVPQLAVTLLRGEAAK